MVGNDVALYNEYRGMKDICIMLLGFQKNQFCRNPADVALLLTRALSSFIYNTSLSSMSLQWYYYWNFATQVRNHLQLIILSTITIRKEANKQ